MRESFPLKSAVGDIRRQRRGSTKKRQSKEALASGLTLKQVLHGWTAWAASSGRSQAQERHSNCWPVGYTGRGSAREKSGSGGRPDAQGRGGGQQLRIRDGLEGRRLQLKGKERVFSQLISYGMTEAERKDPVRYQQGDVVRFHQNAKGGFKKGEAVQVIGNDSKGQVLVMREKNRTEMVLPLDAANRFDVYERRELPLAVGDRIRIAQNGTTVDERVL